MLKPGHREVKFSKEEMEYDLPDEMDMSKLRFVGRGREGIEMARRISKARGAEKRKLLQSLPYAEPGQTSSANRTVQLEPDVAAIFKDSAAVNKTLRAIIDCLPALNTGTRRKTA